MIRDDASEQQVRAADPARSVWLSANAGSGKTRVLIDRVARLLLDGTEPQRILCLTYTKAAASEMQNRLFNRLGEWAMLPEPELMDALTTLGVDESIRPDTLARARRLFARAIETPGGLKIQTIHSFCAGLLRRFPLEARVAPNFTELDDRAAKLMRQNILEELAGGVDVAAVDAVASLRPSEDLDGFLADLCRNRDGFQSKPSRREVLALFGLPADFGVEQLLSGVFCGGEAELVASLISKLLGSGPNDSKAGRKLSSVRFDTPDMTALLCLESVLLHGKGAAKAGPFTAKVGVFPTKPLQKHLDPALLAELDALMQRVETTRARRIALDAAERMLALHRFAHAFLPRYEARKARAGKLDFDDLIGRAAALLSERETAAWVLFRLDGGIDHILIDEAQDTSPGQWQVIERLAEEFTAGEGARGQGRTIFVVGDMKQSIYSFQGADLGAFEAMREHFQAKFAQLPTGFAQFLLRHSFRSSTAILRVVDLTFDERVNRGLGGPLSHIAFKTDLPGRVDLWECIPNTERPEKGEWFDPLDILPDDHHTIILARKVAAEIRRIIDAGTRIETDKGPKVLDEGDFLILVQRRSALFHEIIRACKAEGLEVAGTDRLRLGGELAVRDITALLAFLATPEDDLSLAAALRSPLFGWDEATLYDLAHGREKGVFLWTVLRESAAKFSTTLHILDDLRRQADFLRPYDLIERLLTRHDGRRRLIGRLGAEAEDGIDALLNQALSFEMAEVPSLTGFLVWLSADEVEVKRRLDSASKAIRVITVHGAKGLEAPVVILPDAAKPHKRGREDILTIDGRAVWPTKADESPPEIAAARDVVNRREAEERMRLLYVAMTRAKVWLIVCAAGDVGRAEESWYNLVDQALGKAGAVARPLTGEAFEFGNGKRFEHGIWPEPAERAERVRGTPPVLPDWALRPIARRVLDAPALSPSLLGGPKALPGEEGLDQEAAMRRGSILHSLLEHLPIWPETVWSGLSEAIVEAAGDGTGGQEAEALLDEARRVLAAPDMAQLLGSETLAEVELTARLDELGGALVHGTIDRLLVADDRVLAVDYKSNAIVPDTPEDVPHGLLRQMGAYAAMLCQIYPEKRIETAILWTRTGRLMPLDPDMVRAALLAAPSLDAVDSQP